MAADATADRSPAAIASFAEFWPYYVREHSNPLNRMLHFVGTATIAPLAITAFISNIYVLLLIPFCAYGFAWFGHFVIEKNRPATFIHPWWSLLGDFKMFGYMLTGRMGDEVRRCRAPV